MNFSLESLVQTLDLASRPQRDQTQFQAEALIKQWETQPLFHYELQSVYLNQEVALNIRWLAVILFKNGIDRYWRPSKNNSISLEEKTKIKARVFLSISETNKQLTVQNAHAVSRMVRFDFPSQWGSFFQDIHSLLVTSFQNSRIVEVHNLLIYLSHAIKTLASVRIGKTRAAMHQCVPELIPLLADAHFQFFGQWMNNADLAVMECDYLLLKTLRRAMVEGVESPHRSSVTADVVGLSLDHFQKLIMAYEKSGELPLLEKFLQNYAKLWLQMFQNDPAPFLLLPSAKDIVITILSLLESRNSEDSDFWHSLHITLFTILDKLILFVHKRGAMTLSSKISKEETVQAVESARELLSNELVKNMANLVMDSYLRLRPSDVALWDDEPEEWVSSSLGANWDSNLITCAEHFFRDLVTYFGPVVGEHVLARINQGAASASDSLQVDALLSAFQLCSQYCGNSYQHMFASVVVPKSLDGDRVLRRRGCLMVSEWIGTGVSRETRLQMYAFLTEMLDPSQDLVVRITASQAVRDVIDDWEFKKGDFDSFIPSCLASLMALISVLSSTEMRIFVINVMSIVLERLNPLVPLEPLQNILAMAPAIWQVSETENAFIEKNALLRLLAKATYCLGENCSVSFPITLPLVSSACHGTSEYFPLLNEDGYELWQSIVRNLPFQAAPPQELMADFAHLSYGMENATEILPLVLDVTRSYALIAPDAFNSEHGLSLFQTLSGYLPSMRDDAVGVFASLMEIIVLSSENLHTLSHSGLLSSILESCVNPGSPETLVSKLFLICSRIAFKNPTPLLTTSDALVHLLNVWISRFQSVGDPRNRKILLMGFLSFYTHLPQLEDHYRQVLFTTLPSILAQLAQALEEINESLDGDCEAYHRDYLYEFGDYLDEDLQPTGEQLRFKALCERDPVHTLSLKKASSSAFEALQAYLGPEQFQQLMQMVDNPSLEQLQTSFL